MRKFIIRILEAAIQMLSPKETPHVYYPPNYSPDDRWVTDLQTERCEEISVDWEKKIVTKTLAGITFEGSDYVHVGDGIHMFRSHGYVTPGRKDRMEVFSGDRFYITHGGEFHLLPRG